VIQSKHAALRCCKIETVKAEKTASSHTQSHFVPAWTNFSEQITTAGIEIIAAAHAVFAPKRDGCWCAESWLLYMRARVYDV
jgi:hypothetical protein